MIFDIIIYFSILLLLKNFGFYVICDMIINEEKVYEINLYDY